MDGKGAEVTECINKRHTIVKGDNLTNSSSSVEA